MRTSTPPPIAAGSTYLDERNWFHNDIDEPPLTTWVGVALGGNGCSVPTGGVRVRDADADVDVDADADEGASVGSIHGASVVVVVVSGADFVSDGACVSDEESVVVDDHEVAGSSVVDGGAFVDVGSCHSDVDGSVHDDDDDDDDEGSGGGSVVDHDVAAAVVDGEVVRVIDSRVGSGDGFSLDVCGDGGDEGGGGGGGGGDGEAVFVTGGCVRVTVCGLTVRVSVMVTACRTEATGACGTSSAAAARCTLRSPERSAASVMAAKGPCCTEVGRASAMVGVGV
ncbi:hypothetical protein CAUPRSCDRAFT_13268 [Caulochytrium protostelioides]|uniref:Uncharacterized protein n=1 Tax=Caulochytrium protostelioides TaxID=1555241 RepID=A0A4P9WRV0_9FUNG|nr:hypothetical protein CAUPRSCDRAFT_13268 [Caulochytrium protostelioides]